MLRHPPPRYEQFRLPPRRAQPHLASRPIQSRQDVTVCIAAICTMPLNFGLGIIACSDRMITSGDIEFQPQQAKAYHFLPMAPAALALIAGNVSPSIAICDATYRRLKSNPVTKVRVIADMYATEFANHQRELAQREVLDPYKLTHDKFLAKQLLLDPGFVHRIGNELVGVSVGTATIIAGVDDEGAHLYLVQDRAVLTGSTLPGTTQCENATGFVAIGGGSHHAYSQFSLANYDRNWPVSRALFLLYSAKRRAEVAPGVGEKADWFFITKNGHDRLNTTIIDELEKEYVLARKAEAETQSGIDARIEAFVQDIVKPAAPTTPPTQPPNPSAQ